MSERDRDVAYYPCNGEKCSSISTSRFRRAEWTYDVFLSFRGEDVRYNFADHLFVALDKKNIYTFKDDQTFERGKHLSSIFEAIEKSRFSIIIFSKNYADSSWCLDETVKIVECMNQKKHTAFPVFYHVRASEVREQKTGDFKKAFDEHAKKFTEEKVKSWRAALKRLAETGGFRAHDRRETELIDKIVKEILRSLDQTVLNIQQPCPKKGSELSNEYEGSPLIANVQEVYEKGGQVVPEQLLLVLNATNLSIHDVVKRIILHMKLLCRKQKFDILDDVDCCLDRLCNSVSDHPWFGSRSKISLTTRDKHVLTNLKIDKIHKVESLNHTTLELFRVSISIPSITIVEAANKSRVNLEYLGSDTDHCLLSRGASICIHDEFGIDGAKISNSKVIECEVRTTFCERIHQDSVEPITKQSVDEAGYNMKKDDGGNSDTDVKEVGSSSQVKLEDLSPESRRRCEKAWFVDSDYRSVKYFTHDATLIGINFIPQTTKARDDEVERNIRKQEKLSVPKKKQMSEEAGAGASEMEKVPSQAKVLIPRPSKGITIGEVGSQRGQNEGASKRRQEGVTPSKDEGNSQPKKFKIHQVKFPVRSLAGRRAEVGSSTPAPEASLEPTPTRLKHPEPVPEVVTIDSQEEGNGAKDKAPTEEVGDSSGSSSIPSGILHQELNIEEHVPSSRVLTPEDGLQFLCKFTHLLARSEDIHRGKLLPDDHLRLGVYHLFQGISPLRWIADEARNIKVVKKENAALNSNVEELQEIGQKLQSELIITRDTVLAREAEISILKKDNQTLMNEISLLREAQQNERLKRKAQINEAYDMIKHLRTSLPHKAVQRFLLSEEFRKGLQIDLIEEGMIGAIDFVKEQDPYFDTETLRKSIEESVNSVRNAPVVECEIEDEALKESSLEQLPFEMEGDEADAEFEVPSSRLHSFSGNKGKEKVVE